MKTIFFLFITITGTGLLAQTTPNSNNMLNSNYFTGSNSGVNPAGNPGTIIANTSIRSGSNMPASPPQLTQQYSAYDPGNSANTVIVEALPVNSNTVNESNPVVSSNPVMVQNSMTDLTQIGTGYAPAPPVAVAAAAKKPVITAPSTAVMATNVNNTAKSVTRKPASEHKPGAVSPVVIKPAPPKALATPVLTTYVPENIVTMFKNKYGEKLIDITRAKSTIGNKPYIYIVRIKENGVLKTIIEEDK